MRKLTLFMIALVTIISLTSCENKEESSSQENANYYAVNSTKDRDKIGEAQEQNSSRAETTTTTTTMSIEDIYKYYDIKPNTYNVTADVNEDKVVKINNISIDGKLISFPCDYKTLKDQFELYTEQYNKYITEIPIDETAKQNLLEVHAKPTTGKGNIIFMFTSEEPTTIDKMTCKQVILTASNTNNDKLMTIALPNKIRFGSTYEDIIKNSDKSYKSEQSSNWKYTESLEDEKCVIRYSGVDGGLNSINITFDVEKIK